MAEQSISLPVTPESIESGAGHSRRHSVGKTSSSTSGEKIIPNYLRASTGSCHDFCKYGRKHAFEGKERPPFLRRKSKKPPDEQNINIEIFPEKNKASKANPSKTPEIIKREVSTKPQNRLHSVTSEVMSERKTSPRELLTKSADRQSPVLRKVLAKKKIAPKEALTKSLDNPSSVSSEIWSEKAKKSTQESRRKSMVELRNSTDLKTHASTRIMKHNMSTFGKSEVSSKQAQSKVKKDDLPTKCVTSLKVKSPASDSKVSIVRGKGDHNTGQGKLTSKIAAKRIQKSERALSSSKSSTSGIAKGAATPRITLTRRPSLNRVASLKARKNQGLEVASAMKNQNKIVKVKNIDQTNEVTNRDDVQEKTLYVVKMEVEDKYLDSDGNVNNNSSESQPPPVLSVESPTLPESALPLSHTEEEEEEEEEESEYTVTDSASEFDETEYMEAEDIQEKPNHGKIRMVPSSNNSDQAVKLKFRRGKIIDIDTQNNSPRRLKFRRRRTLEDYQNLKGDGKRSFKRRGGDGHTNDGKPGSEKVVLRHQDVHGKKDAQGLFNNVIEETASKLVETRKSKVKALVGAFETVISLQDKKPVTNTVS